MKKICLILTFALLLSLCACQKEEPLVLDVKETAEKIVSGVEFYEELVLIDTDMAKSLLALDDAFDGEIAMYVGSGASADTVIVAKGDVLGKIEAYLDSQEELYASYMIFEADKIGNALVETKDGYVIVCVTEDTAGATETIKEILE